jgi:hypothetical protein
LVEVDVADLRRLLAAADAECAAAGAEALEVGRSLAQATAELARVRDEAALALLVDHVDRLAGQLHAGLQSIASRAQARGLRDPWAPADALADTIRKLQLGRQNRTF